jgi:hypothetical protein
MFKATTYYSAEHGSPERRALHTWKGLKQRCNSKTNIQYRGYGARGITYDAKWASLEGFLTDMGLPPPGMSLERIDNDGNYCKDNCRWATRKEQNANRRTTRFIEFNGERKALSQWAAQLGLKPDTLRARIENGWPLERALSAGKFNNAGKFAPNASKSRARTRGKHAARACPLPCEDFGMSRFQRQLVER